MTKNIIWDNDISIQWKPKISEDVDLGYAVAESIPTYVIKDLKLDSNVDPYEGRKIVDFINDASSKFNKEERIEFMAFDELNNEMAKFMMIGSPDIEAVDNGDGIVITMAAIRLDTISTK